MTTYLVCPVCGALPPDNGTDTSKANNVVPTASDAVVTASGIIGSATGTTVIVSTGASFSVGEWITVVRAVSAASVLSEKMYITGIATNTLTVLRAAANLEGVPTANVTTPVSTFAVGDYVLTGLDVNGNPPHCPLCGTASNVLSPAQVNFLTGVVAASQHPADVDKVYVTQTDSPEAQQGTASTLTGQTPRISHGFAALNRGTSTVTAETINTTVGP